MVDRDGLLRGGARLLRLGMVVAGGVLFAGGHLVLATMAVLVLAFAVIPPAVHRLTSLKVPALVDALVTASASAHLFGHAFSWYTTALHYDKFLHFLVGSGVALILFLALAAWVRADPLVALPPAAVGLATVALTGLAVIAWELGEFAVDALLGVRNQDGLADTMLDMAFSMAGGLVVALAGPVLAARTALVGDTLAEAEGGLRRALAARRLGQRQTDAAPRTGLRRFIPPGRRS